MIKDIEILELIENKYKSFNSLRHAINNEVNNRVKYGGCTGQDKGEVLDNVISLFSYRIATQQVSNTLVKQYINCNFHR